MLEHPDNANLPTINQPHTILGIVIAFLGLTVVAISLRLYVRFKARLWGWDDLFVVLAGMAVAAGSIITCMMPDSGMGKHFWTLNPSHKITYFKHVWSTNTMYTASTAFIKISILLQYLRLFDMQSPLARRITFGMMVLVSLWGTTFFCLALFSCRPIAKNWNFMLEGTCVAWGSKDADVFFASWAAHASTNMMFDILVFILPVPFLKALRLSGKSRIGLMALFTMGGVVVTLSVARLVALSLKRAGTVPVFDPSYATPSIYIFSVLEINIAILCASIPIFWPLVTSLATNKILVVNEIEIRTDVYRGSQNICLVEQGGIPGLDDQAPGDCGGRISRMSTTAYGDDKAHTGKLGRTPSKLARERSRSRGFGHRRAKPSEASTSGKSIAIEVALGRRMSQESQRKLNLTHQPSDGTLSLSSAEESPPQRPSPIMERNRRKSQGGYTKM